MKAAFVHYWLVNRRGGEAVLEAIGELLPDADLISHVIDPKALYGSLVGRKQIETFISRLPMAQRRYAAYLPLMPLALEMLDVNEYDLIVSSEAGPAKWIIPNPDARHICYCHSPMRYVWDQRKEYFSKLPAPLRPLAELYGSQLRKSDSLSAMRVDEFVANSNFVARRIWKYYRREAEVIYPPVDVNGFTVSEDISDAYLIAGELRSYKRVDLAVRACTELGRRLVVIGSGPSDALKKMAGPTVEFRGRVDQVEFRKALSECRALLFPGIEDFGIVPVEAMASGRPVIAYGKGGGVESVKDGVSGLHFHDASVEGLKQAILAFEAEQHHFSPQACVEQAALFSRESFKANFGALLAR